MDSGVVDVVNPAGEITTDGWFETSSDTNAVIVAILGPQSSGKSTLANALFGTAFPVAGRTSLASATTRGILAARPEDRDSLFVLDVEGADARERGRSGRNFQVRCASFVAALADAIILNMWYHDTCRVDSSSYELLRTVLYTCAQTIADGNSGVRTALVFAIRDVEEEVDQDNLKQVVIDDTNEIWSEVSTQAGLPPGGTQLDEVVNITFVMFPHIRHSATEFNAEVDTLRNSIYDGSLVRLEHSKNIPADGVGPYASTVWDSVSVSMPTLGGDDEVVTRDFLGGYEDEGDGVMAGYRCDAAFSECLSKAQLEVKVLQKDVDDGNKITGLGEKAKDILTKTLEEYDVQTVNFVESPVHEKKRRELETIVDTALGTVYMKNTAICAREALASFKSNVSGDMPADYALYSADAQFQAAAKDGIRPGSSWTFETERNDLHNMMTEIAAQQRKLYDSQVQASVQHSKAIQFLRMQHAQMQAVQQQALGGGVGQWNVGAAYRPPDSNVNVSLGYQQGRTNVQVSMVPDESTSLLGPTGFTAGVGPGNLGLSFNINF